MELKSSLKIFNNYKCDYPENTIKNIKIGLEKLDLKLKYKKTEIRSADFSSYSGDLILEDFGFKTTGKGISPVLAKASAYAEMAERISAGFTVFYNLNSNIEECYELLKDVINRKFLPGFTLNGNSNGINFERINQYFQNDFDIEQYKLLKENGVFEVLVDSYSLIDEDYLKIPIRFIEIASGSNGLAAGNTYEEAIVQGGCEIFERYAACRILSKKITCPTIDIGSINDGRIRNFVEMLHSINIEVLVKDFTFDNKIPVVAVLFINHNIKDDNNPLKKTRYYKMINPGSHLDLKEAILRCLVERLQELTKEELMYREEADMLYDFWTKTVKKEYIPNKEVFKDFFRQFYYYGDLSFLEKGPIISFDKLRSIINNDCFEDVKCIKEICTLNNWDLQVINCMHKTINFPAVRVIIPPISTDSNPYIRLFIDSKSLEKQFNFLYGIKDFYRYAESDEWLNNKSRINKLVYNIEDFLSEDLFSFEINLKRGPFYQRINLFNILALANLSIGNYEESLKYLKFLEKQLSREKLKLDSFNELYDLDSGSSIYLKYIGLIKEKMYEKYGLPIFKFTLNPFHPEKDTKLLDEQMVSLVDKFSKSYF